MSQLTCWQCGACFPAKEGNATQACPHCKASNAIPIDVVPLPEGPRFELPPPPKAEQPTRPNERDMIDPADMTLGDSFPAIPPEEPRRSPDAQFLLDLALVLTAMIDAGPPCPFCRVQDCPGHCPQGTKPRHALKRIKTHIDGRE